MGLKDKFKENSTQIWNNAKESTNDNRARKKRQKQENHLKLGEYIRNKKDKETVNILTLRRKTTGELYFNNDEEATYVIIDYFWDGPRNEVTVESTTTGTHRTSGKVGSTLVGGALLGPIGAIAGASGSRNTRVNEKTVSKQKEVEKASRATITFQPVNTDLVISKEFIWDTSLDEKISKFIDTECLLNKEDTMLSPKELDPVEELRKYKSLLDDEIITQNEFDLKKKELLGM